MRSESWLNQVHRKLSGIHRHGFVRWILVVIAVALFCPQRSSQAGVKFTEVAAPQSPLISFRIIVRVGSINDPKGKEGLNELTASMLAEGGTQELKYPQVLEKLY